MSSGAEGAAPAYHPRLSESLLHRVAAGDQGAVDALVKRYAGLVYSLARRFTYDPGEVEDAVQDVFVALWKSAARFDPSIASEETFIAMVTRRRLIDRRRRFTRRTQGQVDADVEIMGDGHAQALPEREGLSEQAQRAAELIKTLRPEQQQVLKLSIGQGMSHDQIATILNMPLGTVKTHVRRGLIALREAIEADDANARLKAKSNRLD